MNLATLSRQALFDWRHSKRKKGKKVTEPETATTILICKKSKITAWGAAAILAFLSSGYPQETKEWSGRLQQETEFSLTHHGRVVGSAKLGPGTPVRLIKETEHEFLIESSIGQTWVDRTAITITGEPLAFQSRQELETPRRRIAQEPQLGRWQVPQWACQPCGALAGRRPSQEQHVSGKATGTEVIPSCNEQFEAEAIATTNRIRLMSGLNPLQRDENLTRAARFHAAHMASGNYFSQDTLGPDGQPLESSEERNTRFSPKFSGENIGQGHTSGRKVADAWHRSDRHREVLERPEHSKVGIGYVAGRWVQVFGRD